MSKFLFTFVVFLFCWFTNSTTFATTYPSPTYGGIVLFGSSSNPAGVAGMLNFNNTSNEFFAFNGTTWKQIVTINNGILDIGTNTLINFGVPIQAGGGSSLPLSVNPPVLTGSSLIIPSGVDTIGATTLAIERSTTYSQGATTSPTLYVGTLANINGTQTAWIEGIDSELEITAVAGTGGAPFGEAIRGRCVIDNGVAYMKCQGGVFQAYSSTSPGEVETVEAGVFNYYQNAPVPASINGNYIQTSYIASIGDNSGGQLIVDAAFIVNPWSGEGAQAGFECAVDQVTAGTVIRYGCFVSMNQSPYGLYLGGTYTTRAIYSNGSLAMAAAADWVAVASCGSLSTSTKCLRIYDPNGNPMYIPAYGTY